MCSDEDQEETVTEVLTLNKNNERIEHLVVSLDSVYKRATK
jgi:hypothetical protein